MAAVGDDRMCSIINEVNSQDELVKVLLAIRPFFLFVPVVQNGRLLVVND